MEQQITVSPIRAIEFYTQSSMKTDVLTFIVTCCQACPHGSCPHRDAYRRLPRECGGLALCPNLAKLNDMRLNFDLTVE